MTQLTLKSWSNGSSTFFWFGKIFQNGANPKTKTEVLIWRYPSQHAPNQTGLNRRQTIVHFIHIKEFMYWRACNPNLFIRKWHNAYKIQFQILSYKKNLDIVVSFLLWKLDHECKEFPAIWKSTNASSASYHRTINIFVATMERLTGITMQE